MANAQASYMTLLKSYDYIGLYKNAESTIVNDGVILKLNYDATAKTFGWKKPGTADTTTRLQAVEIGTIYDNTPAVKFRVNALNAQYGVGEHSNDDYYNDITFNTTVGSNKPGAYMRVHILEVGEEFWVGYDAAIGTQYVLGTEYGVLSTGEIG